MIPPYRLEAIPSAWRAALPKAPHPTPDLGGEVYGAGLMLSLTKVRGEGTFPIGATVTGLVDAPFHVSGQLSLDDGKEGFLSAPISIVEYRHDGSHTLVTERGSVWHAVTLPG